MRYLLMLVVFTIGVLSASALESFSVEGEGRLSIDSGGHLLLLVREDNTPDPREVSVRYHDPRLPQVAPQFLQRVSLTVDCSSGQFTLITLSQVGPQVPFTLKLMRAFDENEGPAGRADILGTSWVLENGRSLNWTLTRTANPGISNEVHVHEDEDTDPQCRAGGPYADHCDVSCGGSIFGFGWQDSCGADCLEGQYACCWCSFVSHCDCKTEAERPKRPQDPELPVMF